MKTNKKPLTVETLAGPLNVSFLVEANGHSHEFCRIQLHLYIKKIISLEKLLRPKKGFNALAKRVTQMLPRPVRERSVSGFYYRERMG